MASCLHTGRVHNSNKTDERYQVLGQGMRGRVLLYITERCYAQDVCLVCNSHAPVVALWFIGNCLFYLFECQQRMQHSRVATDVMPRMYFHHLTETERMLGGSLDIMLHNNAQA